MALSNEQALALFRKYTWPTICGGVALSLLLLSYFRADAITVAENTLRAVTTEADAYALNLKSASQLKQQSDTLNQALVKIESQLPKVGALASNLQFFYRLETDTGVRLTDVRQVQVQVQSNAAKKDKKDSSLSSFVAIPFTLNAEGSYDRLIALLRALESSSHFCSVQGMSIGPAASNNANSEDGSLTLQMSLRIDLIGTP